MLAPRILMRLGSEKGFSMFELLVASAILTIVGLALAKSSIASYVALERNITRESAMQLALEKIEQMAAKDPTTLTATSSPPEMNLVKNGIKYNRMTTISVNVDGSRRVIVSVVPVKYYMGGYAMVMDTFMVWGNN